MVKAIQFNVKTGKAFRDALALWHIADFDMADESITKGTRIKSFNTLLESNLKDLEKLEKGEKGVLRTKEEIENESATYILKIKAEKERVAKRNEECKKNMEKAYGLFTESLIKAIREYLENIYSVDKKAIALDEMAKFFVANGFADANSENVLPFIDALGQKKGSARKKAMSNNHNTVGTDKELVTIILGAICDEPNFRKELPLKKWENIIEKKSNKKN